MALPAAWLFFLLDNNQAITYGDWEDTTQIRSLWTWIVTQSKPWIIPNIASEPVVMLVKTCKSAEPGNLHIQSCKLLDILRVDAFKYIFWCVRSDPPTAISSSHLDTRCEHNFEVHRERLYRISKFDAWEVPRLTPNIVLLSMKSVKLYYWLKVALALQYFMMSNILTRMFLLGIIVRESACMKWRKFRVYGDSTAARDQVCSRTTIVDQTQHRKPTHMALKESKTWNKISTLLDHL